MFLLEWPFISKTCSKRENQTVNNFVPPFSGTPRTNFGQSRGGFGQNVRGGFGQGRGGTPAPRGEIHFREYIYSLCIPGFRPRVEPTVLDAQ
jgi:hypothetical protein